MFDAYDPKENKMQESVYSILYQAAKSMYDVYNRPPTDTSLTREINSNADPKLMPLKHEINETLTKIRRSGKPKANEVPHLMTKVFDTFKNNAALQDVQKFLKDKNDKGINPALKLLTTNLASLSNLTKTTRQQEMVMDGAELARHYLEKLEKGEEYVKYVASYGFPTVDAMTGGMAAGETIYVSADTNAGKSGLVGKIVLHNLMLGKRVLFASNEQSRDETMMRMVAAITGLTINRIKRNQPPMAPEEVDRVRQCWKIIEGLGDRFLIVPNGTFHNVKSLRAILYSRWGEDHGTDLCIMDLIDGLEPSVKVGGATWELRAFAVQELFDFTGEEGFAMLGTTQNVMNTEDGKKKKDKAYELTTSRFKDVTRKLATGFQLSIDPYDEPGTPDPNDLFAPCTPGTAILKCVRARGGSKGWETKLRVDHSTSSWNEAPLGISDKVSSRRKQNAQSTEDVDEGGDYYDGPEL